MRLFIYCAGGFGREIIDTARRINKSSHRWDEICFIDDDARLGGESYDARLFSLAAALDTFDPSDIEVSIANGEPFVRRSIYDRLKASNVTLATVVDDSAIVSDTARVGEGVIVTAYCSISSSAIVECDVAINTKSIVGHDVHLGAHCVVSSMVNIGGAASVGENSYLGMGVQIKEGVTIGRDAIVGMGSVVYGDIPDGVIALGSPARPMRRNTEQRVFRKA